MQLLYLNLYLELLEKEMNRFIKKGDFFRTRESGKVGMAMKGSVRGEAVIYATEGFTNGLISLCEIIPFSPTQSLSDWVPMCVRLPYGVHELGNGSKVIFNKLSKPLWVIDIDGNISEDFSNVIINDFQGEFLFNTRECLSSPWEDISVKKKCEDFLRKINLFGVKSIEEKKFLNMDYEYFYK